MPDIQVLSFNAGELSPLLDGRSDLEKYYFGCRVMENFIPLPYGPAERRPGTYFVAELKDSSKKARLVPFQYSTEQAYILEYGDEYIRFCKDRGQIQTGIGTEDLSAFDSAVGDSTLLAHWLLNDNLATQAVLDDAIAGSYDGSTVTANTNILHEIGKVGTGCFNLGGADAVEVNDAAALSFDDSGDKPFSIAAWVYVTSTGNRQVILSKWKSGSAREYRLSLDADLKLELALCDDSKDLSASRVAHWKLNDDAANTAVDDDVASVPHDGVASANTDTLSVQGKVGSGCFDFGGAAYVDVSDHVALSFDDSGDKPFSIAAWIYVTHTGLAQIILSKRDDGSDEEWIFGLDGASILRMILYDDSAGKTARVATDAALSVGWHFVVMTYDSTGGATASSGLELYVDNVAIATTKTTETGYVAMEALAADVIIGAEYAAAAFFFADKMDDITLFNKELSTNDIAALWNNGIGTEDIEGTFPYRLSDVALTPGWHQVGATYDSTGGTTAANGIVLYVDGAAVDSTASNEATYVAMENTATKLRIGAGYSGAGAIQNVWADKIDEVALFTEHLTAVNMASLYSAGAYEISSSYLEADLFGLQRAQSADVLFNVHSDYTPTKLTRYAHDEWELADIVFDWPPFLDQNITSITITPSVTVGNITLTASSAIFTSDHVDSYWLIKHPRTNNNMEKLLTTDYSAYADTGITDILVDVRGSWRFRTSGTWTGTLILERAYDGQLVLVLDSAPAGGAWEVDDIITGATSGDTCIIVSVTDSTHYYIKQLSGSFTDDEILSNQSGNSRDVAATYPRYEGWSTIQTVQSTQDQNFNLTGEETLGGAYLRVQRTVDSAGNDPTALISVERYYHYGIVKITGLTSVTSVTATVIRTLGAVTATKLWSEGAWSDERGYPVTTAFFEGRQFYAGTPYRPLNIWGSRVNDYENMDVGNKLADDAMKFTVDSTMQNMIRWLVGQEVLLIGTSGGEWRLGSSDPADAITPTNPMNPRIQTTYGSKEIQALLLANAVLFVDAQGRKVRGAQYIFEKGEAGGYDAPDYTMLAEHITESGIVGMAYQQNPYPILWCWRTDGKMIGMLFEPGQKVWGWFPLLIDGDVESVAVESGTPEDTIWIIVNRTINGSTKRYIEYFKPRDWGSDQADCFFVDSGLTFDGGDAVTITGITQANPGVVTATAHGFSDGDQVKISGVVGMTEVNNKVFSVHSPATDTFSLRDKLDTKDWDTLAHTIYVSGGTVQKVANTFGGLGHLEGETVSVLGDGSVHKDVVVNSAEVTLTEYYNKCHIGKGFTSKLMPMKLAVPGANIRGKKKRIHQIIFSFYKTLGAKFGTTEGSETIPFRKTTDPMGSAPPLFTDEKPMTFPGGYELKGDIYVEQTQPLPMTVRSITAKLGIFD